MLQDPPLYSEQRKHMIASTIAAIRNNSRKISFSILAHGDVVTLVSAQLPTHFKLSCLDPGAMLDDLAIDFYLSLLTSTLKDSQICLAPTYLWQKFHQIDQIDSSKSGKREAELKDSVQRHLVTGVFSKFRCENLNTVVLPIGFYPQNKHWAVSVTKVGEKTIYYYCSAGQQAPVVKTVLTMVWQQLSKHPGYERFSGEWKFRPVKGIPQQQDKVSCGLFMLANTEFAILGKQPRGYDQCSINEFRREYGRYCQALAQVEGFQLDIHDGNGLAEKGFARGSTAEQGNSSLLTPDAPGIREIIDSDDRPVFSDADFSRREIIVSSPGAQRPPARKAKRSLMVHKPEDELELNNTPLSRKRKGQANSIDSGTSSLDVSPRTWEVLENGSINPPSQSVSPSTLNLLEAGCERKRSRAQRATSTSSFRSSASPTSKMVLRAAAQQPSVDQSPLKDR